MRAFASAASLAAASLLVASASAGDPPPAPSIPAPAATPADVMAPPPAAPPGYPAPPPYPGYAPPYVGYGPPGPSAQYPYPYPYPYPYWMGARPVTERRSNGMRITGIVLLSAGGLVSTIGAVLFAATVTSPCVDFAITDEGPPPPSPAAKERTGSARQALNGCDTSPSVGLGVFAGGLLTAVVGIPLLVIGSKQVPAGRAPTSLLPTVSVGAANATLRWSF